MPAHLFSRYRGELLPCRVVTGQEAGLAQLTRGFNRGFQDYKYSSQFTLAGMERFLARSGIRLADCAVLQVWDRAEWAAVGVGLLAVEGDEAWCSGLAVAAEFRGEGGGKALMAHLHQQARGQGVRRLWLEVMAENTAARQLYRGLGYQEQRELLIWKGHPSPGEQSPSGFALTQAEPETILRACAGWNPLRPAWQRRASYLRRFAPDMVAYIFPGTLPGGDGPPVAYALCARQPLPADHGQSVNLFDVGVNPQSDFAVVAPALIQALYPRHPEAHLLVINEPVESRFNQIFAALNFTVIDRQHEMEFTLA